MSENEREKEFLKRLWATFKVEADEHIKAISSGLLELEKAPPLDSQVRIIETIYRQAHSLKGSARAVDLNAIETLCQSLESIFKDFKSKGIPSSPGLFDILQRSVDAIETIVSGQQDLNLTSIIQELEMVKSGALENSFLPERRFFRQEKASLPTETQEIKIPGRKFEGTSTIRVASSKLDDLLLQAEEMIFMKLAVSHRLAEIKETSPVFESLKKKRASAEPLLKSLRKSMSIGENESEKILEYFEYYHSAIKDLQAKIKRVSRALHVDHRIFGGMINSHLEDIRKTMMLPFSSLTEGFPRMVRDLSRQGNKDIDLILKGNEIEIDKRILEEMKDPLIHLLRNAVDHGIEAPDERARKKKPLRGIIEVIISQKENNKVEITVSDDGVGLHVEKIKEKALGFGNYTAGELAQLNEKETLALIFESEFSTSPIITDLSGRGLGLAIVKEKVEKMSGRISLESTPDKGVTFRILLQTTLSTFRGILVEVANQKFIIPTLNVEQVLKINPDEIKTVENRETIKLDDAAISYVSLEDVLQLKGLNPAYEHTGSKNAVVLGVGDRRIAFQVDNVLNEEEVLVKGLGKQLSRVRNISGATVLGSGDVVPILNVVDLLKSAVLTAVGSRKTGTLAEKNREIKAAQKSILVVEDSITSRMLLKNILESAGYNVKVAVDGMDGWISVKERLFDLVVLDIEMPGMNGFELAQKIKQDYNLSNMPVVLVTALESREDREKGIDVGADAYIVKSSFDQSNLIEVVRKLI